MVTFDDTFAANHPGYVAGDFVLLIASDDGCGMESETLNNVFEPFFTTKDQNEGTGLGLATVYGIVKQNNGFINVYSEPGKGTTFRIYLPRYIDPTDFSEGNKLQKIVDKVPQGSGEMILLVEDEPSIKNMGQKMLENLGYLVLSADGPEEGMRIAEEHKGQINLLLTDVVMPEMNGRDFADQLRSLYPEIRILFMSGYTADVIAERGVLEQGVNFIQKPFSKNDLGLAVRTVLDLDCVPDLHDVLHLHDVPHLK
jgi:CheY-like chemotaxis protein